MVSPSGHLPALPAGAAAFFAGAFAAAFLVAFFAAFVVYARTCFLPSTSSLITFITSTC